MFILKFIHCNQTDYVSNHNSNKANVSKPMHLQFKTENETEVTLFSVDC